MRVLAGSFTIAQSTNAPDVTSSPLPFHNHQPSSSHERLTFSFQPRLATSHPQAQDRRPEIGGTSQGIAAAI
jgi:hypothetical protein